MVMISVSLLKKRAVRHVKVNDELELPMVFSPMVMDAYLKNNKMNTLQFQDQLSKDPFSCGGLFWTAFIFRLSSWVSFVHVQFKQHLVYFGRHFSSDFPHG